MVNASGFSRFIGCLTVRYLVQMVLDRRVSANQRKRQKKFGNHACRPVLGQMVESAVAAISFPYPTGRGDQDDPPGCEKSG
jgi:hypothetical protein